MRLFFLSAAIAVAACDNPSLPDGKGERRAAGVTVGTPMVEEAITVLHPVGDSGVHGTVRFTQGRRNTSIRAEVEGLSAGRHGFHVHVYGDCSAEDGSSAGTHFDFEGGKGNDPSLERITGNLGELSPDDNGTAIVESEIADAELNGLTSIIGRSVIVHAKGNDPNQPPIGAAGARVACGVIGIGSNTGEES